MANQGPGRLSFFLCGWPPGLQELAGCLSVRPSVCVCEPSGAVGLTRLPTPTPVSISFLRLSAAAGVQVGVSAGTGVLLFRHLGILAEPRVVAP